MSRAPRRPAWPWTTLLVSLGLAATLGATLYFVTSSLPFFALSPTSDPTFGALNACLQAAVPSRTGFAVSRDAQQALAWSTNTVGRCSGAAAAERWSLGGVTVGAFDGAGVPWVVSQPGGLTSTLLRLAGPEPEPHGETGAVDLAGTSSGVVVLELSGRLLALGPTGDVTGLGQVAPARGARLSVSADGARVAVTGDGTLQVFDARTLAPVRLAPPCRVGRVWWLVAPPSSMVVACRDSDLSLRVDVDTGAQEAAPESSRTPSTLAGPAGPYVVPCDVLPCTGAPPLEAPP